MGQTEWLHLQTGAVWPYLWQLRQGVVLLAEWAILTSHFRERRKMWEPIFLPSSGVVLTTTEEASLRARASGSGLRKRAEVISRPLALRMTDLRETNNPEGRRVGSGGAGRGWRTDFR